LLLIFTSKTPKYNNISEANKPVFWDGENEGGKILMRLRDEYKETHKFNNKDEEVFKLFNT
jgi:hypothetical protein